MWPLSAASSASSSSSSSCYLQFYRPELLSLCEFSRTPKFSCIVKLQAAFCVDLFACEVQKLTSIEEAKWNFKSNVARLIILLRRRNLRILCCAIYYPNKSRRRRVLLQGHLQCSHSLYAVTPRRENDTIICIAFYVARVACRAPDRRPSLIYNVVTHRLLEHHISIAFESELDRGQVHKPVGSEHSECESGRILSKKTNPVVKVVLWSRGGLTWRSQVGANPIPIPTPLIWCYLLGVK